MFCTKCNNNWASLHSFYDEENDEDYHFCPVCHTDMFLVYSEGGKAICDPFTGEVKNGFIAPKEPVIIEVAPTVNRREPQMIADKEREDFENKRLSEYFTNCEEFGNEKAKEMYLKN